MTSPNGKTAPATVVPNDAIVLLRERPRNVLLFRGFGTLVAGVILFLLMLWLAPSVAPEHIVLEPAATATTSTTVMASTTAPTVSTVPSTTAVTGP